MNLGLLQTRAARIRPNRSASAAHSSGRDPVVPTGGRIPFVEDEVHDLQHRGEPTSELDPDGTSNGTLASARVRFARTMRCATVDSGTRKARAISSSTVRPPRSVRATRASAESTGMTRGEDQSEQVVTDVVNRDGLRLERGVRLLGGPAEFVLLAFEHDVAADLVDRPALADRHQPGARIVRDA